MENVGPLALKSLHDLEKYNNEELNELLGMCTFYIEECVDYQLSDTDIDFLQSQITLIERKLETQVLDVSYRFLTDSDMIDAAFEHALDSLSKSVSPLWFALLKYKRDVVRKPVSKGTNSDFPKAFTKAYDDDTIQQLLRDEWNQISSYAYCSFVEVERDEISSKAVLVEFGGPKSFSCTYWCQRFSLDQDLKLIDDKPIYWGEADPRSERFF